MKMTTAMALSVFASFPAHGEIPGKYSSVTNQYVALIYSSQGNVSCVITKQNDKNAIRQAVEDIINNAPNFSHMTGGQTKYPSLRLYLPEPSGSISYSFYNVSLNEFGRNYIKLAYRDKYVYGVSEDLDKILAIIHWGRGPECRKRSRNR